MNPTRRTLLAGLGGTGIVGALALTGCGSSSSSGTSSSGTSASGSATATATGSASGSSSASSSTSSTGLALDKAAWSYDSSNDVYYQIGRPYCTKPQASDYEKLAVYVPGKYFTGTKNSDGSTYTVSVNSSGTVGGYTASTAPIVLPVNTPGYAAQQATTSYSYSDVKQYMTAGFVYVAAGLRGKDSQSSSYTGNAPWGVTDLKAALRYLRYNADTIPGNKDAMFVFGHSGGGAQSAITGSSGDSTLYTPYLDTIGAAMTDANGKTISDAVAGAMCWCPITSLDLADAAYEWNMGQFASSGTRASGTWTASYSKDLAAAFPTYLNKLGLKDSSGKALSLSSSSSGTYLSGTYYDHLVAVVQESLNNFLSDTTFPYTPSNQTMAGMGGSGGAPSGGSAPSGMSSGGAPSGMSSGGAPSGMSSGGAPSGMSSGSMPSGSAPSGASGGAPGGSASSSSSSSTTYQTVAEYIAYLNSDTTWVKYDSSTKKATVLSLEGFVKSQKNASKDVGAFDGIARGETENVVMGKNTSGLHFDQVEQQVLKSRESAYEKISDWKSSYAASEYTSDFAITDSVGKDVLYRMDMYNPMYYLNSSYKGYKSGTIAPHWRIRTGIKQGDTALTTEVNLALALGQLGKSVDFATVWGLGHTMAERTGDAVTNFIAWVKEAVKA